MRTATTHEFRSIVRAIVRQHRLSVVRTYTDKPAHLSQNTKFRYVTLEIPTGTKEKREEIRKEIAAWLLLAGINAELRVIRNYVRGTCRLPEV